MLSGLKRSWREPFDPTYRYSTSWLLPPMALAASRGIRSLYCFVTLFFIYGWQGAHRGNETSAHSFSYFTYLTYWGMAFYFLVSAIHSGTYAASGTPLLARFPRWLQTAHGVFFSTIAVFPFLVTIVYWGIINPTASFNNQFQTWANVSQHALNSIFAFAELLLTRTAPLPWPHIIGLIIILALYLGLAYLTWSVDHFWVYTFLDNRGNKAGTAAGAIIAILAVCVVLYGFIHFVIKLRVWATETKAGMLGKFSPRDAVNRRGRDYDMRIPDAENVDVRGKTTEMEMYPNGGRANAAH